MHIKAQHNRKTIEQGGGLFIPNRLNELVKFQKPVSLLNTRVQQHGRGRRVFEGSLRERFHGSLRVVFGQSLKHAFIVGVEGILALRIRGKLSKTGTDASEARHERRRVCPFLCVLSVKSLDFIGVFGRERLQKSILPPIMPIFTVFLRQFDNESALIRVIRGRHSLS